MKIFNRIKKLNEQKEIDKIISNSRLIAKYKNLDIYITMEQSYRFIDSRTQKLVLPSISIINDVLLVLCKITYGSPDAEVNDVQYFRIYKAYLWYSYNKYSKELKIIDNPEMLNILNMTIIGGQTYE